MTNRIPTFQEWCNNPTEYKKGSEQLSQITIDFWTLQCDSIKALNSSISHLHDPLGLAKAAGKDIGVAALKLIESMLSPEGLAMMGGIIGVNFAVQKVFNSMVKDGLAQYFKKSLLENGIGLVDDGIVRFAAANSGTILSGILRFGISEVVDDGVLKGILTGVFYGVSGLLKGLSFISEEILPVVGEIMMSLQFLGMVFDQWDPCNLNAQLDSNTINIMNTTYDRVFRQTMLGSLESLTDGWGNIYYRDIWPIEMYAENGFLAQETGPDDLYDNLTATLCAVYLENLVFNSNGERICIPVGGSSLTGFDLFTIDQNLSRAFANNNQVVANWIQRYWPIILTFIVILFALLLLFIFRKSK